MSLASQSDLYVPPNNGGKATSTECGRAACRALSVWCSCKYPGNGRPSGTTG